MSENGKRSEHILVVDDDARIRQMLLRYFEDEGFHVSMAADGAAMRECLRKVEIDIILLDLVLPGGDDGLTLAREIRAKSDVPIIMLTGRDDIVDKVVGLEIGADDYIVKPFHLRELLARVRNLLRRRQPARQAQSEVAANILRFGSWTLDLGRRQLLGTDGAETVLTTGEFDMLALLAAHPGRVFTRDMLMDRTRGRSLEAFDRSIDAQIARLRKKLERDTRRPDMIKSVRGVGYVFTGK
jgi:two-component system phosphate regulon response regulator OmpR